MTTIKRPAIFVGFAATTAGEPAEYLEAPEPPKNYGPEKQAEWRQKEGALRWQQSIQEAALCKVTGRLQALVAIDPQRKLVLSHAGPDAAGKFFAWLAKAGYDLAELVVFGFDSKEFVRVAGVQGLIEGHAVPLGFWYQNDRVYDPYHMLVEDARRKYLPLPTLLRLLEIAPPDGWTELHQQPDADATLAFSMAVALQLLPAGVDATQFDVQKFPGLVLPRAAKPPAT